MGLEAGASPGSSYPCASPFRPQMTSHQAPGEQVEASVTGNLEMAGAAGPEPVTGGSFPQESAALVSGDLQMGESSRWRTMPAANLRVEPRPAEEAVEDHLNDWLSRWTEFQPMR